MAAKYKPEELVQFNCVEFLRKCCPNVIFWSSVNGFYAGRGGARFGYIEKLKRLGMLPGVLDIQIMWKDQNGLPRCCFIELKAGYNKPTPEQLELMDRLRLLGFDAGWAKSLDGFIVLLNKFGVPTNVRQENTVPVDF